MKNTIAAVLVLLGGIALTVQAGAATPTNLNCIVNTGLNPVCPISGFGIASSDRALTDTATQTSIVLFGQRAWDARNQIQLTVPIYEHLTIANVGQAGGSGDAELAFTRVLTARPERFMQAAGVDVTVPSGSPAFSGGRIQFDPSYALSYAPIRRAQLLLLADYAFESGGTKLPFAPRTQTLRFQPRAIFDLSSRGAYAALDGEAVRVTGDYRYQAYDGTAILGVVSGHVNVSASYQVPLTTFSRENLFHHALGFQVTWQR